MLWKKTGWFWKSGFAAISFVLALSVAGCSDALPEETGTSEKETPVYPEDIEDDSDELAGICLDLYKKAEKENKEYDLEIIRTIVNRFGEYGYPAVDTKNQINMSEAEQVIRFCEKAEAQEEAEITIFVIDDLAGFVKYDLQAKAGNVDVTRSYYGYENETIQRTFTSRYPAEDWRYTEEGYLMFSGVYFSEELYALTLSGMEDYNALRVEPLDETCRELNRKYLQPVGYAYNNVFITDWNEHDFGELDFYDLYDLFYKERSDGTFPYVPDDDLGVGAVYRIPREEFEDVIMTHFNIDSETLQSKTIYDQEDSTYESMSFS